MAIHFERTRDYLKDFHFQRLFIEELGWSHPARRTAAELTVKDAGFSCRHIAELAGVVVVEVEPVDGPIPDARTRAAVHKEVSKQHHENLLIFIDRDRTQSLWYWVKRQDGKVHPRDHLYCKGQPGDLFLSKLSQMVFDLADFDAEGNVSIVEVARRLQSALDIERVTKKFFRDFQDQHVAFLELIQGIDDERQRRWYASVLLNRLMFIYFLQKKPPGFLDGGNQDYLRDKLTESKQRGKDRFYSEFLKALFFEGFAKPEGKRSPAANKLLGKIKYLNGGLFLPHKIEQDHPRITVPDRAFESLIDLFDRYTWHLDDTPGGKDDEINPDVLGYIFEKYINQKAFGAYYTRTEITEYLCERTIHQSILDAVNSPDAAKSHPIPGARIRDYSSLGDLLMDLDAPLCRRLIHEVLPALSILDPACGSGAFLVAAMKTLINVYSAVIGRVKFLHDKGLTGWLKEIEQRHPSVGYFIKKRIITDNLYGVDIMEEATEIARLRLFLALVASAQSVDDLEPLPNIDFNILAGNSLIGLMRVDDGDFEKRTGQKVLFRKSYKQVLEEKNRLIDSFRHASEYAEDLSALRDTINERKREAYDTLNAILQDDFRRLGIKYEEATWDTAKNKEGKSIKRLLTSEDIDALHPFHWGFEFDEILNKQSGFDVILTNPPWEVFQTNEKEFFHTYASTVRKNKTRTEDWKELLEDLMKDREDRDAWLGYVSGFPHVSAYFKQTEQYKNNHACDSSGKRIATKINLYPYFTEQCFNLLRPGGRCGIIVPGGIYSDLGTKQLRELLFTQAKVESLFGLSNERFLFEGVDHRQKLCLLVYEKGGSTESFEAAFRINPREAIGAEEMDNFLHVPENHIRLSTSLVRRLSPDTLSVMEFQNDIDVRIAEKLALFPPLGQPIHGKWNVKLTQEFNVAADNELFETSPGAGRLPLFTGKMFQQFARTDEHSGYWIAEKVGRRELLGATPDEGQCLDYQRHRWVHRRIARNTDSRTMISTLTPRNVFTEVNSTTIKVQETGITDREMLFLCAVANSFVLDWCLRKKVSSTLNMFYIYQLPIPRLTEQDVEFSPIVERAARLICTTPEYDDLAKEAGLKNHKAGYTDGVTLNRFRAELDGLVAHLYGLTEEEFAYILATFPVIPDPVKIAARNAYRDVERGLIR